jgi:anti-sigma-K factor RskA
MMPSDPNALHSWAGEYVLGQLSPEDRAELERELPRNAPLRRAVGYWQTQLLPMSDTVAPLEPDPHL